MNNSWRKILGVKVSWQMPPVVVFDNGGKTVDRYTIIDTHTGDVFNASDNPFSPTGVGQYVGDISYLMGKQSTTDDYLKDGSMFADYIQRSRSGLTTGKTN